MKILHGNTQVGASDGRLWGVWVDHVSGPRPLQTREIVRFLVNSRRPARRGSAEDSARFAPPTHAPVLARTRRRSTHVLFSAETAEPLSVFRALAPLPGEPRRPSTAASHERTTHPVSNGDARAHRENPTRLTQPRDGGFRSSIRYSVLGVAISEATAAVGQHPSSR